MSFWRWPLWEWCFEHFAPQSPNWSKWTKIAFSNHVFYDVWPQKNSIYRCLFDADPSENGVLSTSQIKNPQKSIVFWCGPFSNPVFYDVWPQKTSKRLCLFDTDPSHYGVLSKKPPQSLPRPSQSIPQAPPSSPKPPKASNTLPQKNDQNEKKNGFSPARETCCQPCFFTGETYLPR